MLLYREIKFKLKRFQFELTVEEVGLRVRSKQKYRQHIVQPSNLLITCMDFFVLSLLYFSNDPTLQKKISVNVTGQTDVCNFFM